MRRAAGGFSWWRASPRWGYERGGGRMMTWFELRYG